MREPDIYAEDFRKRKDATDQEAGVLVELRMQYRLWSFQSAV